MLTSISFFRCPVPTFEQVDGQRGVRSTHEQASPGRLEAALHPRGQDRRVSRPQDHQRGRHAAQK